MGMSFWKSKNGQEVDFIIENDIALEVKTTKNVQPKGLKALQEELLCQHYLLISQDPITGIFRSIMGR